MKIFDRFGTLLGGAVLAPWLCGTSLLLAACGSSEVPPALAAAPGVVLPTPTPTAPVVVIEEPALAKAIRGLKRNSTWTRTQTIALAFDPGQVQGMVRLGDQFHLVGETASAARARLYTTDATGNLLRELTLEDGPRSHAGGLSLDGRALVTAISEAGGSRSAVLTRIEADSGAISRRFMASDVGDVALSVPELGQVIVNDRASKRFSRHSTNGSVIETLPDASRMVEWQDCKTIGFPYALCTGVQTLQTDRFETIIQAITLRDVRTMAILHEVPFGQFVDTTVPALGNASFFEIAGDKLRLYVVPVAGADAAIEVYETPVAPESSEAYPFFTRRGDLPLLPSGYTAALPPLKGLAAAFVKVDHQTEWLEKSRTALQFVVQHAQGILKIGELFYLTDVDRSTEQGYLHTFRADGSKVRTVTIATAPDYHPGGLDYDGRSLLVPVARYVTDSSGQVLQLDPVTLAEQARFVEPVDHLGGVARDRASGLITAVTWGSRRLRTYTPEGQLLAVRGNPTHMSDWQDCKSLDDGYALCAGVIDQPQPGGTGAAGSLVVGLGSLGAVALVHVASNTVVHMFPWMHTNQQGRSNTQNTFFAELDGNVLRFYFASDDMVGNLFVYEARLP